MDLVMQYCVCFAKRAGVPAELIVNGGLKCNAGDFWNIDFPHGLNELGGAIETT
jgi:hypothetical protein